MSANNGERALPRVQQDKPLSPYRKIGIFTVRFNCLYQGGSVKRWTEETAQARWGSENGVWDRNRGENRILWPAGCFRGGILEAWNITLIFFKLRIFNFAIFETSPFPQLSCLLLPALPPSPVAPSPISGVAARLCQSLWSEGVVLGGTPLRLKRSKTLMSCAWRMPFTLLNLHRVWELSSGGTFVYWHTNEHLHGAMLGRRGPSSSLIA